MARQIGGGTAIPRASQTGNHTGFDGVLEAARRIIDDAILSLRWRARNRGHEPNRQHPWGNRPFATAGQLPLLANLLGRKPIEFSIESLRPTIANRTILVTGAAGSIGSELCRQIAALGPRCLIAFDYAESALFELDQEIRGGFAGTFVPWIGDIRDEARVQETFERHAFDSVFHAAAYKHVPLMEAYPLELVRTNVFGTWNLARAAAAHGVTRFVLISTDKAVRPANLMGLTKRVAEILINSMAAENASDPWSATRFAAVRFGNVLGSSGSVVPVFHEQIARGGPVRVTDPEVRRYFMTTGEAVHLVLQAASMSGPSGTFVLDMGEPVRITDLAERMIRAWGLEPGRDIDIQYVGLRPGEKLDEELIAEGETALATLHPKIRMLQGATFCPDRIAVSLQRLRAAVAERDDHGAVALMAELAPDYRPAQTANKCKASIPAVVGSG